MEEIDKLLEAKGTCLSYWNGEKETALYYYGDSFAEMREALEPFVRSHPRCEKCRIEQIA